LNQIAYLLNHSDAYHLAMGIGMTEYWIERLIFRNASWKGFNIISIIGNKLNKMFFNKFIIRIK